MVKHVRRGGRKKGIKKGPIQLDGREELKAGLRFDATARPWHGRPVEPPKGKRLKVGLRGDVYLPEAFLRVAQGVNDAACDGEVDVSLNFFQNRFQRIIEAVAEQQIVDVVGRERAYGVEMALHDAVGFLINKKLAG